MPWVRRVDLHVPKSPWPGVEYLINNFSVDFNEERGCLSPFEFLGDFNVIPLVEREILCIKPIVRAAAESTDDKQS